MERSPEWLEGFDKGFETGILCCLDQINLNGGRWPKNPRNELAATDFINQIIMRIGDELLDMRDAGELPEE